MPYATPQFAAADADIYFTLSCHVIDISLDDTIPLFLRHLFRLFLSIFFSPLFSITPPDAVFASFFVAPLSLLRRHARRRRFFFFDYRLIADMPLIITLPDA